MKLIQLELYKLFKRKDTSIIYAMLLIPLLYSVGFANNVSNITYHGDNNMTGFGFAGDMFVFGFYIFIFLISCALSMINSCRGEIGDGSIALLINRAGNRKIVFLSKIIAHFIYMIIFTLIFVVFSVTCYLLFLKDTEISTGYIFSMKDSNTLIAIISVMLMYFFAITLSGLISTKFNVIASTGIFIVIWAVLMYVKEFDAVNTISPIFHLINTIDDPSIGSLAVYLLNISIYIFLTALFGTLIFERSDLD